MELGGFYVKFERVLLKNGGKFINKNIKKSSTVKFDKKQAQFTSNLA